MARVKYLLLLSILLLTPVNNVQAADDVPLHDLIQAVGQAQGEDERRGAFYDLAERFETGRIALDRTDAAEFTELLLDLIFESPDGAIRMRAGELLKKHPHPLAAQRLISYLEENPNGPPHLTRMARAVLSQLKRPEVFCLLTDDLHGGKSHEAKEAINLLIDLGDPRTISHLKVFLADTTLTDRMANEFQAARAERGNDVDPANLARVSRMRAEDLRSEVRKAIPKLELLRDTGISCGFDLPDEAMATLGRQGAVVMPWLKNEMYEWYDEEYPFVTTDFVYHTHMILVRAAIDELERVFFHKDLGSLAAAWAQACMRQAQDADVPADRELALDNTALLAVPGILCGGLDLDDLNLDINRRSHVEAELARVKEARYVGFSPLLKVQEDYTEYRLRGRASAAEDPGNFQAQIWLARACWPVADQEATRRALLLIEAFLQENDLRSRWLTLDRAAEFIAGPLDDPDIRSYLELAEEVSGKNGLDAVAAILKDGSRLERFVKRVQAWWAPRINTSVDPDRRNARGLRLLGQRYSPDGHLFQVLLESGRWPVSGLDVVSVLLGSERARELLSEPIPALLWEDGAGILSRTKLGVMNGWRNTHRILFDPPPGLSSLFRSTLWQEKLVNSALGAWAETRHAAAPYLKAAHIYSGMSAMTDRFHGYVEPYPEFFRQVRKQAEAWHALFEQLDMYARIDREKTATMEELDERFGQADERGRRPGRHAYEERYEAELKLRRLNSGHWPEFMAILDRLADLAERELRGEQQTVQDGVFLKALGRRMRNLSFNYSSMNVAEEPMARIIDVATDYNRGMTEAGIGHAMPIFVALPDSGRTIVCRGAVYSYYEMTRPIGERMDDEIWSGLSGGLTVLGIDPWLAGNSDLMHQPVLTRSELQDLHGFTAERPELNANHPWHTDYQEFRMPGHWVGARTRADDADLLLELAKNWRLTPDLHLFVNRQISRFAGQPLVLEYWRATLDRLLQGEGILPFRNTSFNIMQMFWGLQALIRHGDATDKLRLNQLGDLIDDRRGGRRRDEPAWPVLKWEAETAKRGIGGG